jgi:hypothetical protein
LRHSEIYGREVPLESPHSKGSYQLKAQLFPTSFTSAQLKLLEQKHIRTVPAPRPASPMAITVN